MLIAYLKTSRLQYFILFLLMNKNDITALVNQNRPFCIAKGAVLIGKRGTIV